MGGPAWAQEDLDETDLQNLLDDKPAEVSTQAKAPEIKSNPAPANPNVQENPDALSSETVDLDTLDNNIDDTPEPVAGDEPEKADEAVTETKPEGPVRPAPESPLEPLSNDSSESTADVPSATSDDLDTLKSDLADEGEFIPAPGTTPKPEETAKNESTKETPKSETVKKDSKTEAFPEVFDVGAEERTLLTLARNIEGQISDNEWNEVATAAKVDTYTVVKNDWLFKISKKIFGTGFYYPKIWSINSYITNPHFIEPGMVLSFTTGSGSKAPEVKLGAFTDEELNSEPGSESSYRSGDLASFGEETTPPWVKEKNDLQKQGVYFQYASEETMEDLQRRGELALNREYENYEPPALDFGVVVPKNYDKDGFDRNSRIFYSFKEGFYLSTFLSTNIVQDFGYISNGPDENIFFTITDHAYVKFDESINAVPGDRFSVYSAGGKVSQKNSDREGFKYTIVGQIRLIKKIEDKWEVEFTEVAGTPQRNDRITTYTPKIDRITRTYNSRIVEAAIMSAYEPGQMVMAFGNVIYLDRGRADGVEMGNVFEVYGFKDRFTTKNITSQPTYKVGELTVITLTDNFATAIVTKSSRDFYAGDIAITKTKEAYLREQQAGQMASKSAKETLGGKSLEELDVELNLENINDDLLKEADKIQLTEDELAELERQERDKSVIKDSERDLKQLERLENDIESAEKILNDAKGDEDKLIEKQDLNDIEKKKHVETDSLDEIEQNLGKRYLDEDLNSKDNPYGLTEFDVEEVDELLNTEKKNQENQ
jgi:hypothetical protein